MARLRREWVSVEQAQQWLKSYDPKWLSEQVKDAIVKELQAGKEQRWYHAIVVDRQTDICHDGLDYLLAITKAAQGRMCWVARADDFHFSAVERERTPHGDMLITREMDRVERTPFTMPYTIIEDKDLPEHLRRRPNPTDARTRQDRRGSQDG